MIQNITDPNEWKWTPRALKVYKDVIPWIQTDKINVPMKWIGDTIADADETQKYD